MAGAIVKLFCLDHFCRESIEDINTLCKKERSIDLCIMLQMFSEINTILQMITIIKYDLCGSVDALPLRMAEQSLLRSSEKVHWLAKLCRRRWDTC